MEKKGLQCRPNGPARKHWELQSQSLKLSVVLLALPQVVYKISWVKRETEDLDGEETAKKKTIVFSESLPSTFVWDFS